MYTHILVATDGSELSNMAIEHAVGLAQTLGAKISVITVLEPPNLSTFGSSLFNEFKNHAATLAQAALNVARDAAKAADVQCELVCVEDANPYRAIIETAATKNCDAIVMASHGRRGVSAIVLGSETVKVLNHSAIPVIVVRGQSPASYFAAS